MPTGAQVAFVASTQAGDPYIFGAEASVRDRNPRAFDCSELVEWTCGILGVSPRMPDGSKAQKAHCARHGTLVPVSQAIDVRGALLFRMSGNPTHVAISMGNGRTIEAMGRAYGVGHFNARGRRWTHGGLIPGVMYGTPEPPPALPSRVEMARVTCEFTAKMPDLHPGDVNLHVIWLQRGLNIAAGAGLKDDGFYGPATTQAVANWQRWFSIGPDKEPAGHACRFTRWMLTTALQNIRDAKA